MARVLRNLLVQRAHRRLGPLERLQDLQRPLVEEERPANLQLGVGDDRDSQDGLEVLVGGVLLERGLEIGTLLSSDMA